MLPQPIHGTTDCHLRSTLLARLATGPRSVSLCRLHSRQRYPFPRQRFPNPKRPLAAPPASPAHRRICRAARPQAGRRQGRRESNSQPPVLETGALPIELHPCWRTQNVGPRGSDSRGRRVEPHQDYWMILVTTPDPTVLPPSRIAKRTPSSMAIGFSSSTVTRTLSPGMHISASTRLAVPVTSVVRK